MSFVFIKEYYGFGIGLESVFGQFQFGVGYFFELYFFRVYNLIKKDSSVEINSQYEREMYIYFLVGVNQVKVKVMFL